MLSVLDLKGDRIFKRGKTPKAGFASVGAENKTPGIYERTTEK